MDSLKEYFRPEFINRLDDIIVFDILSEEAVKEIVKIQVDVVKERLSQKGIQLEIMPESFSYLVKEGYSPQYGARPLKRLIQNKVMTPVASLIISKGIKSGETVVVGIKENNFTFEVKKRGKINVIKEFQIAEKTLNV